MNANERELADIRESIARTLAKAAKLVDQSNAFELIREIKYRARFFTGHGVETCKVRVDADGTIRVWDSVAGHYTTCHALSESASRRIRKMAAK